jgi:hypothetical protein
MFKKVCFLATWIGLSVTSPYALGSDSNETQVLDSPAPQIMCIEKIEVIEKSEEKRDQIIPVPLGADRSPSRKYLNKLAAAGLSTAVIAAISHPIDLLRMRKQVGRAEKGNLYKGVMPFGVALCTTVGVQVSTFDTLKEIGFSALSAGAIGVLTSTAVTTPIWVLRSRSALAPNDAPYGVKQFWNSTVKKPAQAYHGFAANIAILPFMASYYHFYEAFNSSLVPWMGGEEGSWKESFRSALSAGGSRIMVAGFTFPIDTVRTIREVDGSRYPEIMRRLYAEGKITRFYRGFPLAAVRVVLSSSIGMGLYPAIKKILDSETTYAR